MKKRFLRYLSLVMVIVTMMSLFAIDTAAAKTNDELGTPKVSISLLTTPAIKLSWSEVDGADMYYVYRRDTSKGSLKLYAKTEKLYYKDTAVKEYGKYYYKVKAVSLNSKGKVTKRSAYSPMVTQAVVNLKAPKVTAKTVSDSKINLSWNAVDGADRYYIYMSTSKNGSYKSLGYVTKKSYTVSKLEGLTTYYFKIKSAKVINGKVYKSDYSTVKSTRTNGKNGEFIVEFDKITNKQYNMPNGSAMTTLAMLINYYGKEYNISTTPDELVKYFNCTDVKVVNGVERIERYSYGTFAGDPYSSKSCPGIDGWGEIMAWSRFTKDVDVEEKIIGNAFIGYWDNFSGMKEYLNKGKISICLIEPSSNPKNITLKFKDDMSSTGYSVDYYTKTRKYVILCGYTDTDYIFYDPATGKYESYLATNKIIAHFIPICDYATAKWYATH